MFEIEEKEPSNKRDLNTLTAITGMRMHYNQILKEISEYVK
jgi:hypothetical protein